MRETALLFAVLVSSALLLAACGGKDRTNQTTVTTVYNTTVGEELTELQAAYASGAINEREYEQQRRAILERNRS